MATPSYTSPNILTPTSNKAPKLGNNKYGAKTHSLVLIPLILLIIYMLAQNTSSVKELRPGPTAATIITQISEQELENIRIRQRCHENFTELDASRTNTTYVLVNAPADQLRTESNPSHFIVQFGRDDKLPDSIVDTMIKNRAANPNNTFKYFSLQQGRAFIKNTTNATVLDAFDAVQHDDLRISMFKFHYMHTVGGIYLDLTAELAAPVSELAARLADKKMHTAVGGQVIIANAGSPVMLHVFNIITNMMIRRLYGQSLSGVAGNGLVASGMRNFHTGRLGIRHFVHLFMFEKRTGCALHRITHRGRPLVVLNRYGAHVQQYMREQDLMDLWLNRRLYYSDTVHKVDDAELKRRLVCPLGQSEWIAYTPVETPLEEQVVIPAKSHVPARATGVNLTIPKVIFQTGMKDVVPPGMHETMEQLREMNPDFEYRYFADADIRKYILTHTNRTVLAAFDSLIPGAFKADFFRYVFLYVEGGVYVDADEVPMLPFSSLLQQDDTFVSPTDPGAGPTALYNAFIATTAKHPVLEEVLRATMDRIFSYVPCRNPLAITGPIAFGDAFAAIYGPKMSPNPAPGVRIWSFNKAETRCSIGVIRTNENVVAFETRYPVYKKEMKWFAKQQHYWDMCAAQMIFNPMELPESDRERTKEEAHAERMSIWGSRACPGGKSHLEMLSEIKKDSPANVEPVSPPTNRPAPKDQNFTEQPIPHHIMQFGLTSEVPPQIAKQMQTWKVRNPTFQYTYFSESSALAFARAHFPFKLTNLFNEYTTFEDRALCFCFLFLVAEGGVCAGLDVESNDGLLFETGEQFLSSVSQDGELDTSILATAKAHTLITLLLKDALQSKTRTGKLPNLRIFLQQHLVTVTKGKLSPMSHLASSIKGRLLLRQERSVPCIGYSFVWHGLDFGKNMFWDPVGTAHSYKQMAALWKISAANELWDRDSRRGRLLHGDLPTKSMEQCDERKKNEGMLVVC